MRAKLSASMRLTGLFWLTVERFGVVLPFVEVLVAMLGCGGRGWHKTCKMAMLNARHKFCTTSSVDSAMVSVPVFRSTDTFSMSNWNWLCLLGSVMCDQRPVRRL